MTIRDYLQTNLLRSREYGADQYYRTFLCPLFFEGFAKPKNERSREMTRLLGSVPYLNGGIFSDTRLRNIMAKGFGFPTLRLSGFSISLNATDGTLTTARLETITKSPRCARLHLRKIHQPKTDGAYYTKEDIRTTLVKTPSFLPSGYGAKETVKSHLNPLRTQTPLPYGNS